MQFTWFIDRYTSILNDLNNNLASITSASVRSEVLVHFRTVIKRFLGHRDLPKDYTI